MAAAVGQLAVGQPVPSALADASVLDVHATAHALRECWADHDAALIFVRHFACAGCSRHVAELRPRIEELIALGVALALVGNGTPDQLAGFVEREQLAGFPIATYTDPTLAAYRAAGLDRSIVGTMGPRALANLAALWLRGHPNRRTQGDILQQGGTLYITRAGVLAFIHRSARVGDHAPVTAIVDVALAARATDALAAGVAP